MISPLGILSGWLIVVVTYASSVCINVLQAVVWCLVFLPYKTRLGLCQTLSNTWWEIFCFILEVWGDVPFVLYNDAIRSNECAIMIGNHCAGSLDFASGVCITSRAGGIGTGKMMTMMKASLQFVPTVGWTHVLQGSLFLKRNWESDHKALSSKLTSMEDGTFPRPFWVGLYPEGTRITPKKWQESVAFAPTKGLPVLNNVLLPRTKGFVFLAKNLPSSIDAIYDVTIGYSVQPPGIADVVMRGKFRCRGIHVHCERIPFADLPKDDKGISDWLVKRFEAKDRLLGHFNEHGVFPGERVAAPMLTARWSMLWLVWAAIVSAGLAWIAGPNRRALVGYGAFALALYTLAASFVFGKRNSTKVYPGYHPVHANGKAPKGGKPAAAATATTSTTAAASAGGEPVVVRRAPIIDKTQASVVSSPPLASIRHRHTTAVALVSTQPQSVTTNEQSSASASATVSSDAAATAVEPNSSHSLTAIQSADVPPAAAAAVPLSKSQKKQLRKRAAAAAAVAASAAATPAPPHPEPAPRTVASTAPQPRAEAEPAPEPAPPSVASSAPAESEPIESAAVATVAAADPEVDTALAAMLQAETDAGLTLDLLLAQLSKHVQSTA